MYQPRLLTTTLLLLILLGLAACGVSTSYPNATAQAPSHELWDSLLQQQVSATGVVNYQGFIDDRQALDRYLNQLSTHPPADSWTREERLSYWINAYNAYTIELIADNYPVESIQDLHPKPYVPLMNSVWHRKFFKIGGKDMTLNAIEHRILRPKFNEPRIHFAIVCASKSCPQLLNRAFTPQQLETQLTAQTKGFLADSSRNKISKDEVQLSKIFSWFKGDFTEGQTLIEFLNQYAPVQIDESATITHLNYDWSLNNAPLE